MGTIFEFDTKSKKLKLIHDFKLKHDYGAWPEDSPIQLDNGIFYGTTSAGGKWNLGVLYSYDISDSVNGYKRIIDFDGWNNGLNPKGRLLKANNGKIYGATSNERFYGGGGIFELDPLNPDSSFKIIHRFSYLDGNMPEATLFQASNGKIYGTTKYGGSYNKGILFSFDTISFTFTKLFDFDGINSGSNPIGELVEKYGKLFGVTSFGSVLKGGFIYSFDISNTTTGFKNYEPAFEFSNSVSPVGGLLNYYDDYLFGIGTNTLYSFYINSLYNGVSTFGTFYYLTGTSPTGSLVKGGDGQLYATASDNGKYHNGTLFSVGASYLNKVFDFKSGEYGSHPLGTLTLGKDGKLYGVTKYGGGNDKGTFYSFDITNTISGYKKIFNFQENEGANPTGALVQGADNKLYGVAKNGGIYDYGIIFSIDVNDSINTFKKLFEFDGQFSGISPIGTLLLGQDSLLYGVTRYGGEFNQGVLYRYNPLVTENKFTKIIDFNTTITGGYPTNPLSQSRGGKILGALDEGYRHIYPDKYTNGVIYSIEINTTLTSYSKIVNESQNFYNNNFNSKIIEIEDNNFYGISRYNRYYHDPSIFYISSTAGFRDLVYLNQYQHGDEINSNLLIKNDILFGVSTYGGKYYKGTIFGYDRKTNKLLNFYNFKDYTGSGSLIEAFDGKLYGMASAGGKYNKGVIYSCDVVNTILGFEPQIDFDGITGATPILNELVEFENPITATVIYQYNICSINGITLKVRTRNKQLKYQWYKNNQSITGWNSDTQQINDPNINDEGIYYCTANSSEISLKSDLITVVSGIKLPAIFAGEDLTVCNGQATILSAKGGINYTWSGGVFDSIGFYPTVSGVYSVFGQNIYGCINSDTVSIKIMDRTTIVGSAFPNPICSGIPFAFTLTGASFGYFRENQKIYDVGTSYIYTSSGNYFISVTGYNYLGCNNYSSFILTVTSPSLSKDTISRTICENEIITISVSGKSFLVDDKWNDIYIIKPTFSGNYSIIEMDSSHCQTNTILDITVNPKPTIIGISLSPITCLGIDISLSVSGVISHTWLGISLLKIDTGTAKSKILTVVGIDTNGCINSDTLIVHSIYCENVILIDSNKIASVNQREIDQNDFIIYPNPFENEIIVDSKLDGSLNIFNSLGREILKINIQKGHTKISLQNLPYGLFISIFQNDKIKLTNKLIHR